MKSATDACEQAATLSPDFLHLLHHTKEQDE